MNDSRHCRNCGDDLDTCECPAQDMATEPNADAVELVRLRREAEMAHERFTKAGIPTGGEKPGAYSVNERAALMALRLDAAETHVVILRRDRDEAHERECCAEYATGSGQHADECPVEVLRAERNRYRNALEALHHELNLGEASEGDISAIESCARIVSMALRGE